MTRLGGGALPRRHRRRRGRRRRRVAAAPRRAVRLSRSGRQSDELAVIGIWGPTRTRRPRRRSPPTDVSNGALPFRQRGAFGVGGTSCWRSASPTSASSDTSCTSLPAWAVQVWDRLLEAGAASSASPRAATACSTRCASRRAIAISAPISPPGDDPLRGRPRVLRRARTRSSSGARRLKRRRAAGLARRIRTLLIGEGYVTAYGGEAVIHAARPSAACEAARYGFTIGRMIGFAYLPVALGPGSEVTVEVLGRAVAARVADDVLYDPSNARVARDDRRRHRRDRPSGTARRSASSRSKVV